MKIWQNISIVIKCYGYTRQRNNIKTGIAFLNYKNCKKSCMDNYKLENRLNYSDYYLSNKILD